MALADCGLRSRGRLGYGSSTMSAYSPSLGDLVIVHDPRLAAQIGRVDQLGVVIHRRRNGARVLFLPDRMTYWIEPRRLYRHPAPGSLGSPATLALGEAVALLDPEEAEVESIDATAFELRALAERFTARRQQELVARLGPRLLDWEVIPHGMAMLTVVLRLAIVPS
jgi:hypothetical protein